MAFISFSQKRFVLIALGAAFLLACGTSAEVTAVATAPEPTAVPAATSTPVPAPTEKPTTAPSPTVTPEPVAGVDTPIDFVPYGYNNTTVPIRVVWAGFETELQGATLKNVKDRFLVVDYETSSADALSVRDSTFYVLDSAGNKVIYTYLANPTGTASPGMSLQGYVFEIWPDFQPSALLLPDGQQIDLTALLSRP
jgi:hypothetical protein